MARPTPTPTALPISKFGAERRVFLGAVGRLLGDPTTTKAEPEIEIESTINA